MTWGRVLFGGKRSRGLGGRVSGVTDGAVPGLMGLYLRLWSAIWHKCKQFLLYKINVLHDLQAFTQDWGSTCRWWWCDPIETYNNSINGLHNSQAGLLFLPAATSDWCQRLFLCSRLMPNVSLRPQRLRWRSSWRSTGISALWAPLSVHLERWRQPWSV